MNNDQIRKIIALTKKNLTLYVKKGPVLIFGLMFPFFMLISWILGREISSEQVFIGIVSMTSFFTATAVSPVILPIETREKSLERVLASPISLGEILMGIIFASALYSFIITSIISMIFLMANPTLVASVSAGFILYLGILLMAFLGSLIGLLISGKPTDQTSDIMVLMNLIKFPLLFLGGVFLPLQDLSSVTSILNLFSPLTYLTELLRGCTTENSIISPGLNILILCIWIMLLFFLNFKIHKKTMPRRFSESVGKKKMMMGKGGTPQKISGMMK